MADRQKTVMLYINCIHRGGAERVITQLAENFAADGYRSVLVTSYIEPWREEFPLSPAIERCNMEPVRLYQPRLVRNLSRVPKLRKLCREYRPDVLIAFTPAPSLRAVLATVGLPVKTLVSVRNLPEKEYPGKLMGFAGRHILPLADGCVFQTEQARAWFPEKLQKKSRVIMNQVAQRFFEEPPAAERHDIVTVGRLFPQKNHALLIRAYAALGPTEDRLVIHGEGVLRPELEALIRELGLEGRVLLPGVSGDVPCDIGNAKLFVLSSDFEGMPNALLEAMALGLPCISTDCPCGGPAAVIRDGENGFLIPVDGEEALTQRMRELLENEEKRAEFARAARETAGAFRPETVFRQWRDYVEFLISDRGESK